VEIHHKGELPLHDNIYCFTDLHLDRVPKRLFKLNPRKTNL
jgi:hypothetical protein